MAGQPDLFTKRVRKPPPAKEFAVHCALADLLRINLAPGWLFFHPANGELRDKATAGRLQRMGVKPGVSDFILISPPSARLHALELKRRGEKPSEAQYAFLFAVTAAGGRSAWCDKFDDAIAILTSWGALRTTVSLR